MRPRSLRALRLLVVPLAGLTACVHEREKALVTIEDGALAPPGAASVGASRSASRPGRGADGGASSRRGWGAFERRGAVLAAEEGGAGGGEGRPEARGDTVPAVPVSVPLDAGEGGSASPVGGGSRGGLGGGASPIVEVPRVAAADAPSDSGGVRLVEGPRTGTSSAAPAHRPIPAGTSLERLAKEKFLDALTELRAEKVTLYLPPPYAAEANLSGAAVTEEGPGRRTAAGGATLVLRRLTIRAARITLVAKGDPEGDVQLSARGDVTLRSDQPASIVEETGLRSLLLRNDGYTPLR